MSKPEVDLRKAVLYSLSGCVLTAALGVLSAGAADAEPRNTATIDHAPPKKAVGKLTRKPVKPARKPAASAGKPKGTKKTAPKKTTSPAPPKKTTRTAPPRKASPPKAQPPTRKTDRNAGSSAAADRRAAWSWSPPAPPPCTWTRWNC